MLPSYSTEKDLEETEELIINPSLLEGVLDGDFPTVGHFALLAIYESHPIAITEGEIEEFIHTQSLHAMSPHEFIDYANTIFEWRRRKDVNR